MAGTWAVRRSLLVCMKTAFIAAADVGVEHVLPGPWSFSLSQQQQSCHTALFYCSMTPHVSCVSKSHNLCVLHYKC